MSSWSVRQRIDRHIHVLHSDDDTHWSQPEYVSSVPWTYACLLTLSPFVASFTIHMHKARANKKVSLSLSLSLFGSHVIIR